jgi:hypothetical protein
LGELPPGVAAPPRIVVAAVGEPVADVIVRVTVVPCVA